MIQFRISANCKSGQGLFDEMTNTKFDWSALDLPPLFCSEEAKEARKGAEKGMPFGSIIVVVVVAVVLVILSPARSNPSRVRSFARLPLIEFGFGEGREEGDKRRTGGLALLGRGEEGRRSLTTRLMARSLARLSSLPSRERGTERGSEGVSERAAIA